MSASGYLVVDSPSGSSSLVAHSDDEADGAQSPFVLLHSPKADRMASDGGGVPSSAQQATRRGPLGSPASQELGDTSQLLEGGTSPSSDQDCQRADTILHGNCLWPAQPHPEPGSPAAPQGHADRPSESTASARSAPEGADTRPVPVKWARGARTGGSSVAGTSDVKVVGTTQADTDSGHDDETEEDGYVDDAGDVGTPGGSASGLLAGLAPGELGSIPSALLNLLQQLEEERDELAGRLLESDAELSTLRASYHQLSQSHASSQTWLNQLLNQQLDLHDRRHRRRRPAPRAAAAAGPVPLREADQPGPDDDMTGEVVVTGDLELEDDEQDKPAAGASNPDWEGAAAALDEDGGGASWAGLGLGSAGPSGDQAAEAAEASQSGDGVAGAGAGGPAACGGTTTTTTAVAAATEDEPAGAAASRADDGGALTASGGAGPGAGTVQQEADRSSGPAQLKRRRPRGAEAAPGEGAQQALQRGERGKSIERPQQPQLQTTKQQQRQQQQRLSGKVKATQAAGAEAGPADAALPPQAWWMRPLGLWGLLALAVLLALCCVLVGRSAGTDLGVGLGGRPQQASLSAQQPAVLSQRQGQALVRQPAPDVLDADTGSPSLRFDVVSGDGGAEDEPAAGHDAGAGATHCSAAAGGAAVDRPGVHPDGAEVAADANAGEEALQGRAGEGDVSKAVMGGALADIYTGQGAEVLLPAATAGAVMDLAGAAAAAVIGGAGGSAALTGDGFAASSGVVAGRAAAWGMLVSGPQAAPAAQQPACASLERLAAAMCCEESSDEPDGGGPHSRSRGGTKRGGSSSVLATGEIACHAVAAAAGAPKALQPRAVAVRRAMQGLEQRWRHLAQTVNRLGARRPGERDRQRRRHFDGDDGDNGRYEEAAAQVVAFWAGAHWLPLLQPLVRSVADDDELPESMLLAHKAVAIASRLCSETGYDLANFTAPLLERLDTSLADMAAVATVHVDVSYNGGAAAVEARLAGAAGCLTWQADRVEAEAGVAECRRRCSPGARLAAALRNLGVPRHVVHVVEQELAHAGRDGQPHPDLDLDLEDADGLNLEAWLSHTHQLREWLEMAVSRDGRAGAAWQPLLHAFTGAAATAGRAARAAAGAVSAAVDGAAGAAVAVAVEAAEAAFSGDWPRLRKQVADEVQRVRRAAQGLHLEGLGMEGLMVAVRKAYRGQWDALQCGCTKPAAEVPAANGTLEAACRRSLKALLQEAHEAMAGEGEFEEEEEQEEQEEGGRGGRNRHRHRRADGDCSRQGGRGCGGRNTGEASSSRSGGGSGGGSRSRSGQQRAERALRWVAGSVRRFRADVLGLGEAVARVRERCQGAAEGVMLYRRQQAQAV